MRLPGFVGVVVVAMTVSCGTDSARPAASSDHAVAPLAAAPGESRAAVGTAHVPAARGTAQAPVVTTDVVGTEKPAQEAKPSAPVKITASFGPGTADLDVVFESGGTGVTIKVWGVDGLKITKGSTPISTAGVRSGQSLKVAVQYDAPTTVSNLAVSVSGTFAGQERVKVQSFQVGNAPATAPAADTTVDSAGRRIKVMKAE